MDLIIDYLTKYAHPILPINVVDEMRLWESENIGLKIVTRSSNKKITQDTDIYLVDTYGEALNFYKLSKITFVGGSLISHGGQNPLEPARTGNFILHGPNTQNFHEVYNMLSRLKISTKVNNANQIEKIVIKNIKFKQPLNVIQKLNLKGNTILKKNLNEINKYIK